MPMKIVQAGDLVLRRRAQPLTPDRIRSREIQNLIASMRETMHKAPGVGLAAPQVGISLQLAVIEDKSEYTRDVSAEILLERERKPVPFHVLINPVVTPEGDETREFYEGCLSVAGFTAVVARTRRVRVDCLDHHGTPQTILAAGWYARILQHETDHLDGTLYLDRMQPRTFSTLDNFNALSKEHGTSKLQQLFDR